MSVCSSAAASANAAHSSAPARAQDQARAEPEDDDPDVLDRVEREQPLEVVLEERVDDAADRRQRAECRAPSTPNHTGRTPTQSTSTRTSGSAFSCSASARCRRSAASSTRCPARPQAAARAPLDRERRDHRARPRRVPRPARARRATSGRRSRSRPRCCTPLNHAVFKALLFLGAGAFERAVGSLELDRLGGLLRRMPWTGGAFLVGAMAIAGLPPLNGFASEWLTLQSLLHVPLVRRASASGLRARSRSRRSPRPRRSRVLCFVKVVGLVLLGPPRRDERRGAPSRRRCRCAPAVGRARRRCASCSGSPRGCSSAALVGLAPWAAASSPATRRPRAPRHGLAADRRDRAASLVAARRRCSSRSRGGAAAAPAPTWACGQRVEPRAGLDVRRLHQAAAARARGGAAPAARDRGAPRRRRRAGGRLQRPRAAPARRRVLYGPVDPRWRCAARPRAPAADRPARHLRRLPARARPRAARAARLGALG